MPNIINLDKEWENISEAIYDLLSEQPTNDLANSILSVLEEYAARKEIVELPVTIGNTIYEIYHRYSHGVVTYKIMPRKVDSIQLYHSYMVVHCGRQHFFGLDFGRIVFTSEERAKRKLDSIRKITEV